jgi:hypothetical protein
MQKADRPPTPTTTWWTRNLPTWRNFSRVGGRSARQTRETGEVPAGASPVCFGEKAIDVMDRLIQTATTDGHSRLSGVRRNPFDGLRSPWAAFPNPSNSVTTAPKEVRHAGFPQGGAGGVGVEPRVIRREIDPASRCLWRESVPRYTKERADCEKWYPRECPNRRRHSRE